MKSFIFFLIFIILASFLSSCTSKEDRCEQIAFAMMKRKAIKVSKYRSQVIQRQCVKHYDDRGYSEWRSCMLSAENSLKEMQKCKIPPFISMALLNNNIQ